MGKRKYTPEQINTLLQALRDGKTYAVAAGLAGMSISGASKTMRAHGYRRRKGKRSPNVTPEQTAVILALYDVGVKLKDIGERVGLSAQATGNVVYRHRTQSRMRPRKNKILE